MLLAFIFVQLLFKDIYLYKFELLKSFVVVQDILVLYYIIAIIEFTNIKSLSYYY